MVFIQISIHPCQLTAFFVFQLTKGQHFTGAGLDVDLLRGLFDGVPRGRLLLRYLVPAVPQAGELKLAVFIGVVCLLYTSRCV